MGGRIAMTVGLAVCLACWVPAAHAAEVKVVSQRYHSPFGPARIKRLVIVGGRERNHVLVSPGAGTVVSDRAGIAPGHGCKRIGASVPTAVCAVEGEDPGDLEPPPVVRATLGPGNDDLAFRDEMPEAELGGEIEGGPGDDRLSGGLTDNILRGGPGRDDLIARGDSTLFDEGGPGMTGSDTFRFGSFDGTLSYAGRSQPVQVDMRRPYSAGGRGEHDHVLAARAESFGVIGGHGNDHLVGRSRRDTLLGGAGADVIAGRGGNDVLLADGPRDADLAAGRGFSAAVGHGRSRDRLSGGSGADTLYGNRGRNRLDGGPGADTIQAGAGNDLIAARDRSPDLVDCGLGLDRALLDGRDDIGPARSVRCELPLRDRPAAATVAAGVEVDSGEQYLVDQGGGFIDLRCPADAPPRCRGSVEILRRRRVMARGRFSIGRRGGAVPLRITRDGKRAIEQGGGQDLAVIARVVSRDRWGTLRTVSVGGYRMNYDDPDAYEGPGND